MSYTKGRPLCPEEKKLLVSVKHYFDRNKSEFGSTISRCSNGLLMLRHDTALQVSGFMAIAIKST